MTDWPNAIDCHKSQSTITLPAIRSLERLAEIGYYLVPLIPGSWPLVLLLFLFSSNSWEEGLWTRTPRAMQPIPFSHTAPFYLLCEHPVRSAKVGLAKNSATTGRAHEYLFSWKRLIARFPSCSIESDDELINRIKHQIKRSVFFPQGTFVCTPPPFFENNYM